MIPRAVPGLVLLSFVLACGTPPSGSSPTVTTNVAGGTSSDTASAVAKASEPRSADPTAARPVSPLDAPKNFGGISMTGAPPAASPDPSMSSSMKTAPQKISARHVLIQWMGAEHAKDSVVRSKDQAYKVAQEVLRRARAHDDFARLAVEFSDEPNAGSRGGSLGRFGHGQMVPAFEEAAFKLDVGQISDIVETPFGFHVIQRTE